jgi:hypothetical protein
MNVKERHAKGHQNHRGNVIGSGPYETDFTFESFCEDWEYHLKHYLTDFQNELSSQMMLSPSADEVVVATKLHHANATGFYHHMGGARKFVSHSTCFYCLGELAVHPLPCGHVLCTPCVKGYGKPHEELSDSFTIATCPLHDYDAVFSTPAEIHFKPQLAGLRILSLDGHVLNLNIAGSS